MGDGLSHAHHALTHTRTSALDLDCIYTIALWPRHRLTQEIRHEPLFAAAAVIVAAITCTCRSHHNKGQEKNSIASSPILPCSAVWGAGISCVG
jgi:hypothetical protein